MLGGTTRRTARRRPLAAVLHLHALSARHRGFRACAVSEKFKFINLAGNKISHFSSLFILPRFFSLSHLEAMDGAH